MLSIIGSFIISWAATLIVIRLTLHRASFLDQDISGSQKFHIRPVPRIGGLAIFCAVAAGALLAYFRVASVGIWIFVLLLASLPAFGSGIMEDITKNVSPLRRLVLTMFSAILGYALLGAAIRHTGVSAVDALLAYGWIALPFTALAVGGVANAFNIIDGFNGLAAFVSITVALSMAYVGWQVGDAYVTTAALILAGAVAGFLFWNYPFGMIFLGDGGAYFIGFILGDLVVLLIERNRAVSPWYAVLLLLYPIFETLFSIYRKKFVRGISPGVPDGIHLHMLIFKRMVRWTVGRRDAAALTRRNSLTSPYLWMLSSLAVVPATMFWSHTWVLVAFCIVFMTTYIWLYVRIVRFKAPRWMILRK